MHVFGVWEEAQVLEGTHTDRPQQAREFNPSRNFPTCKQKHYRLVFYLFMYFFLLWFKTISLTISKKNQLYLPVD